MPRFPDMAGSPMRDKVIRGTLTAPRLCLTSWPTFVTLRAWKRTLRLQTPTNARRAKSDFPITSFSGGYPMKKLLLTLLVAFGFPLVPVCQAQSENPDDSATDSDAQAEPGAVATENASRPVPAVFQAAGPDASSIQSTVDAFRAALGGPNGNNPGPLPPRVAARSTGTAPPLAPILPHPRLHRSTCSWTRAARASPRTDQAFPRRLRPAGPKAALKCFSTIRPTPPSSAPSARCDCSLQWGATSPMLCFLYPAPMGLPQQW